jgi:hypothetical protein
MRKKAAKLIATVIMISFSVWVLTVSAQADRVTLVGEVSDNQEIVADGQIYTVGESSVGDDLVHNYISQKVKVVGRIVQQEEGKIIIVESFEVVGE